MTFMPQIGKTQTLQVVKEVDFGFYLDGGELGEILLPAQYISPESKVGDELDVFLYLDSEDRIIATTEKPYAEIGECAYLRVVDTSPFGAFMDWGLAKDLLIPFKEQRATMQVKRSYVVYIYEDKTGRICGSSKLDRFLNERAEGQFEQNQPVDLLIVNRSPLGYKAVIDGTHLGVIHNSDALVDLDIGQKITGYIKTIRLDDAIDLTLQQQGAEMRHSLTQQILLDLKNGGGSSDVTDKSSAEEIFSHYQVSKGNYKKALGQLYKEKKILLGKDKITLVKS